MCKHEYADYLLKIKKVLVTKEDRVEMLYLFLILVMQINFTSELMGRTNNSL